MASIKVPYLVEKPGRRGPRYFWQPSKELRALGWRSERLRRPDGMAVTDAAEAVAIAQARNDELARWRAGQASPRRRDAKAGTLDAMIVAYKRSKAFLRLRPSTQRVYRQSLERISHWAGDMQAAALTPGLVQKFYDSMAEPAVRIEDGRRIAVPARLGLANGTIRVLRLLLEWGRRADMVADNAARRPGLRDGAAKGRLWSPAAVAAFVAAADRMGWHSVGTAVLLDEWIGQREGDVLALTRGIWHDGALHLTQSKTGAAVVLPIGMVQPLVARLEAELARGRVVPLAQPAAAPLLVCETTGRPWKGDHFRHTFSAIRAAAAAGFPADDDHPEPVAGCPELAGLWFMHLRHTAVTRLAEAKCPLPLIAAVTGHSLATVEAIVDRYLIRTAAMAREAFRLRLDMEGKG